ncbi:MAG: CoA transferase [Burkholderiaceae bacterium]|jgi:alpha-methylacyl-CoA racemase|nr:CoA transferase [Burkholderiaceae bacterium]
MTASPPLAGLKVVELHAIGPVPFAGQLLRSLGADVLRVSPPVDPGLGVGVGPEYDLLNLGKRALAVDLKQADGLAVLRRELADADVLLEGFRPGVLERLGLAPATLLDAHPRLVVGRLSGWGHAGEFAERAGHDINYLALSGVLNAIGAREAPVPPLNLVADFGGGAMHLLVGVLAKLVQRSITQRGGVAETSILAGTVGLTPMVYGLLAGGIWNLKRANNLLDGAMPFYRVYRCADGRFVAAGALEPKFYAQLLAVTGLEGEIDPRDQYRPATWPATTERFAARFASRSRDDWAQAAQAHDACLSPVLDFAEAARHPHNLANGLYRDQPFAQPADVIEFDRHLRDR